MTPKSGIFKNFVPSLDKMYHFYQYNAILGISNFGWSSVTYLRLFYQNSDMELFALKIGQQTIPRID